MANAAEGALDEDEDYYAVLNVGRDVSLSLSLSLSLFFIPFL